MAKFGQPKFIFVIARDKQYLKVKNNAIEWIDDATLANKYASKYAAKDHLRSLTDDMDRIEYVEWK